ncbi:MAG TPA: lipid II flippase MurJ [Ktedonobacteraceae bacterium]|nr:lipid II flippase MurJ [Ktedonobacteraceae bacterium]
MAKDSVEEQSKAEQAQSHIEAIPVANAGLPGDAEGNLPEPLPVTEASPEIAQAAEIGEAAPPSERRHIVKSASLVMLGNLGSSVMGMVRQVVVTALGPAIAGPFNSAILPARTFNDFLINGSISGALIPTFNDYAAPEKRDELRRVVFSIVNFVLIIMVVASILYALLAPNFVAFLVQGYKPDEQKLALQYSQIIFFSLIALGPFAVLLSALFALKEFGWPAFATASYHIGIILGAIVGSLLGERYYGHLGLAFGVIVGAFGEIALLLPGMRNQHLRYMFVLDLKHPALRRIVKLYAPVSFSFLVTMGLVFLDQHLASLTRPNGAANYVAMTAATTLIQFPVGLVAAALSFAVLPTLSEHARAGDLERFKGTLLLGFRLGLLLMIPAAAGLIVLREPIVLLIFKHHKENAADAALIAVALQNYAYQLPFVAIDQLLIAAFYARKNTIIPVTVYVVSILGYLVVALPFWQTIGMPALAFANTVQNSLHAIILLVLLRFAIGSIHIRQTLPTVLKILLAAAALVAVAWGLQTLFSHIALFSLQTLLGELLTVLLAGGLATAAYLGCILLLKVEEVSLLKGAILAKLGRK